MKQACLRKLCIAILLTALLFTCGCVPAEPVQAQSFALDTIITVKILQDGTEEDAQAALQRIDACEKLLSSHREGSDLFILNEEGTVQADPLTIKILSESLAIAEQTDGALDLTLLEVSGLWDYHSEHPRVPEEAEIQKALQYRGMDRIFLQGDRITAEDVRVDLGAVAKGAIGDEARKALRERGVSCALLNLGGNILTLGDKPDGTAWNVAVEDPRGAGMLGTISFYGEKSVATSSGAQRFFVADGVTYHHILNPETGQPARSGICSATVLSPDGLTADALSTALFVAGEEKAEAILKQYPDCGAVLLKEDGSILTIGNIEFIPESQP